MMFEMCFSTNIKVKMCETV